MLKEIIIYDTEYWTDIGVQDRRWGGLDDYPPLLIQIAAKKIVLDDNLPELARFECYIKPKDQHGCDVPITPFFTKLTKITPEIVREQGVPLARALDEFKAFCGDNHMYSYGNDIRSTFLPSCYEAGIQCPFTIQQTHDIRKIFRKARALSDETVYNNTSGTIAEAIGAAMPDTHFAHDAMNDVDSIIAALRHVIKNKDLDLTLFK